MRVNVEIIRRQTSSRWIVRDVAKLVVIVFQIADTVIVVSGMPDFLRCQLARSEGITTLHELHALREVLLDARRDEQVNVSWHDGKTVQLEFSLRAIPKQSLQKEVCMGRLLKMWVL